MIYEEDKYQDVSRSIIIENKVKEQISIIEAVDRAREFGDESSSTPISEIILDMIKKDVYQKLLLKADVYWDMDLSEAVNNACIRLGLSDDDFSEYITDLGNSVEITLV